MSQANQFQLFRTRRFLPLFCTQFLGAFNDNLFKTAILVLMGFFQLEFAGVAATEITSVAAGIFILPFFLLSATAGQLAEKYDKASLARAIKLLEIAIMAVATFGFYQRDANVLMLCLFLMGVHSTLFGPLKYSILPQYLDERELLGGNGMIEMGTFVAILIGQIAGASLVENNPNNAALIAASCMLTAILGYLASLGMPAAPPQAKNLQINWNIFTETWHILKLSRRNMTVFHSLMGISWFWFFGAVFLNQFLSFAKDIIGGEASVYILLLGVFSVSIGIGSALCEVLSNRRIEIGLVPFGSIGMCLFTIDFYFARPLAAVPGIEAWGLFSDSSYWRMLFDLGMLGVFGGFFIVPLYALIQTRTEPEFRSRIIAANNILNACFMVTAALLSLLILKLGVSVPELLLIVGLMNIPVAIYVYGLQPEFLMRFLAWLLSHTLYRVRREGLQNIPEQGPAILVCNHVSFMDPILLAGSVARPVRFVMDHRIFKIWGLNWVFKAVGAVPIAPSKEDSSLKDAAFKRVEEYLAAGELVCIFPEGMITWTGEMNPFKPGVLQMAQLAKVPVIPMALRGLWGSFFSRKDGSAMLKLPRRFNAKIEVVAASPIPSQELNAEHLFQTVLGLRGELK